MNNRDEIKTRLELLTGHKLDVSRWQRLLPFVSKHENDTAKLVEAVAIGTTEMFRDPTWFDMLEFHVLPKLLERSGKINIWSIGCSTGEELFSLGMILARNNWLERIGDFIGTDLLQSRLETVKQGLISAENYRCLDQRCREYVIREADTFKLSTQITSCFQLQQHNIVRDPVLVPASGQCWDLILIRNVLIYFDLDVQSQVLENLAVCLDKAGYLITAPVESLIQHRAQFEVCFFNNAFAFTPVN